MDIVDWMKIGFVVLFLLGFVSWCLEYLKTRHLKRVHPLIWEEHGSPGVLGGGIQNGFRAFLFLWRGQYKRLGDRFLSRIAIVIRALAGLWFLLFLAEMSLLVLFIFS